MSARLEQLRKLLDKTPNDAFVLYGIALELKKSADFTGAADFLTRALAADADYLYAYYQLGQVREQMDDPAAAKAAYDTGIQHAQQKNDQKALGELKQARDLLD